MLRLGADRSLLRIAFVLLRRGLPRQTRTGAALVFSIAAPRRLAELAFRVMLDRLRPQPFRSVSKRQQPVCLRSKPVPRITDLCPPHTAKKPSDLPIDLAVVQVL